MLQKIIFLLIVTVFFVGCEKPHVPEGSIKIGAILELTGALPEVGESGKNAAEMAIKEVNDEGGLTVAGRKIPIELFIEDDAGDTAQSVIAAKKLIKQDKVLAVVGPNISAAAIAAADVAEETKTLLITPWSTAPETTMDMKTGERKHYVFRICFSDPFEGRILVNFARYTKNYKTAAILYEAGSESPTNQANIFKQSFEKLGGRVVAFENYAASDKNFSTQLAHIKAANPEVLFLPDYYSSVALIAQQARKIGIRADFLGSDNWNRPDLASLAHGALEGAYFASHYSPDDRSAVTQAFVEKYRKLYGKTPDDVAALTYDAYQLLFKAIAAAKNLNREAIRNSLVELPLLEGVTGTIDYQERFGGEPNKSAVIVQVQGDKFIWVTHANP